MSPTDSPHDDILDSFRDVPWKPGAHEWWAGGNSCRICGVHRYPPSPDEPLSFRIDGEFYWEEEKWEVVCPPCRPRIDEPIFGLHATKDVAERIGITPNNLSTRATFRRMRPFAVLTKPHTYLWSSSQVALLTLTKDEWAAHEEQACARAARRLDRVGRWRPGSISEAQWTDVIARARKAQASAAEELRVLESMFHDAST